MNNRIHADDYPRLNAKQVSISVFKTIALTILACIIALFVLGITGCAFFPKDPANPTAAELRRQTAWVNGASFAAYSGTIETLKYLPTKRAGFERAVTDLERLETGPIDVAALTEIIKRLDVKELKSTEASLIIGGTQLVLITTIGATPLDRVENLRPIVAAIREGIVRGLSAAP